MTKKVTSFILLFLLTQILTWFQTYGQFRWEWFGKNTWIILLSSIPVTYLWIIGTRHGMEIFNGKSWSLRFVGFSMGIIVFTILSRLVLNEQMTLKTLVSLVLCLFIILIQFIWK